MAQKKLPDLSAICMSRCGLNVPSVSIYIALPSPPPMSIGSCMHQTKSLCRSELLDWTRCATEKAACPTWHVTQSVWQSCVLPHLNSPAMTFQAFQAPEELDVTSRRCKW